MTKDCLSEEILESRWFKVSGILRKTKMDGGWLLCALTYWGVAGFRVGFECARSEVEFSIQEIDTLLVRFDD